MAMMDAIELQALIEARAPGHGLTRPFYTDHRIFEREFERFFADAWLYAGHASELPQVGDYLLVEFAGESIIVVRGGEDRFNALLNVCRHRGSRICGEPGHGRRFVCPYHGWTYGLDGTLLAAAEMPPNFHRQGHGLRPVHCENLAGLLFVNLAAEPVPFAALAEELAPALASYRLEHTQVAARKRYPIAANWKLAIENYCECYHCRPAHPEYARGHALATPAGLDKASRARADELAAAAGLLGDTFDRAWRAAGRFGAERQHQRYLLKEGHLTGSRDGRPLAPLLGELREPVGVATDIQVGPMLFGLAYCDHVVLYRFLPLGVRETSCEVSWLVRDEAEAGRDFDPEALTWLWDVTTRADQRIIEANQAGVASRFYEPGPFSTMEDFTDRFVQWYLDRLA